MNSWWMVFNLFFSLISNYKFDINSYCSVHGQVLKLALLLGLGMSIKYNPSDPAVGWRGHRNEGLLFWESKAITGSIFQAWVRSECSFAMPALTTASNSTFRISAFPVYPTSSPPPPPLLSYDNELHFYLWFAYILCHPDMTFVVDWVLSLKNPINQSIPVH